MPENEEVLRDHWRHIKRTDTGLKESLLVKSSAEELMLLNCGVGEDSRVPWTSRRSNQSILKEIQPVHSEGDQPWDFFGRNNAKAETPVLWPPHAKS